MYMCIWELREDKLDYKRLPSERHAQSLGAVPSQSLEAVRTLPASIFPCLQIALHYGISWYMCSFALLLLTGAPLEGLWWTKLHYWVISIPVFYHFVTWAFSTKHTSPLRTRKLFTSNGIWINVANRTFDRILKEVLRIRQRLKPLLLPMCKSEYSAIFAGVKNNYIYINVWYTYQLLNVLVLRDITALECITCTKRPVASRI